MKQELQDVKNLTTEDMERLWGSGGDPGEPGEDEPPPPPLTI